ncbi:MAG TPA: hypothetical protein VHO24_14195 [Opitutaceae bacterium]|nr:hypothetical protein [Opitutaceae bacterium]
MTSSTETFSWRFGGWLSELPPNHAWGILGGAALLGVAFAIWSYHQALIEITPGRRLLLCTLRVAVWLGLLVILAAPTRVQRTFQGQTSRPLAVLVDRSGSMTTPDNRQRRRLDDALLRWRAMEPAARAAFSDVKTFAFSSETKSVSNPESAVTLPTGETRFFSSLAHALAEAPAGGWGGIVTLSDGLDTQVLESTESVENTVRSSLAAGTPLFFVPGRNRYAGGKFFTLREFNLPPQTAPRTTFRVEATFDSFQLAAQTIDVVLKIGGVARPAVPLRLEAGRRLSTWSTEIQADQPGTIELELRAGEEIARAAVRVEAPSSNRILYFQGALDWSYRFLADILKRDSSFTLTPVFNFPNPNAPLPRGALSRLPSTAAELAGFDIVVLSNATASQFTAAQQTLLSKWVQDGGVLVFLTPDDDSTQGFAGSELEKMLPVVFLPPQSRGERSNLLRQLRSTVNIRRGSSDAPQLTPYAWEDSARVREIFAEAKKNGEPSTPVFAEYAHVAHAKPGAEVLARHPNELMPGSKERAILLALQRYGRGQSAVLTSDALWRWKLNQPSTERGVELFWQNLFSWLARDRQRGLSFEHAPLRIELGQEITLKVIGAGPEKLGVTASLDAQRATLREAPADADKRVFQWKPPGEGYWQITAVDSAGREARHWLAVDKAARGGEFSGMAPDEEIMRTLAARTGGAVLEGDAPASWQETQSKPELLTEHRAPLWHRDWIFGTLLGLYGIEMLLRRKWHLL